MHNHNRYIDDLTRKENDTYNKSFLKRIDCQDFIIEGAILHGDDWEKKGYHGFQTVWLKNLDRLMSFLIEDKININEYCLLDIGSGIGISTMYLGEYYSFKSLKGLELDRKLSEISKKNLKRRNDKHKDKKKLEIEFICENAVSYKIKDPKNIIFMFNSLGWEALEKFINNNLKLLQQNNSILLQSNDHCINNILNYAKLIKRNDFYNISAVKF